ncbi:hypothetical protein Br6_05225 [Rhodococcus sp. Br-6]|nr:hypothetical protein Br6_05225 [Rhodococcus sp. Br-6]
MRTYNGAPAHTDIITAGTELWRVHRTDSRYPANSFNLTGIAPLIDYRTVDFRKQAAPTQGRFEPVHDENICPGGSDLGGYLYLGLSVAAGVAEGVIRGNDISKTGMLEFGAIAEVTLTKMTLGEDVEIAVLDTQAGLAAINQDNALVSCDRADYRDSRITCTQILVGTPAARGVRYPCRHGKDERAVMLVDRRVPLVLHIVDSSDLSVPGWGQDVVVEALHERFDLSIDLP